MHGVSADQPGKPASSEPLVDNVAAGSAGAVAIAAGGTGGHVYPAIALAGALRARGHGALLLTDERGLRYVRPEDGVDVRVLASGSPSGAWAKRLAGLVALGKGFAQARALLAERSLSAVVAFGGYAAVPPALAGLLKGMPLVVHEQNAVLGRANRLIVNAALKLKRPVTLALSFEGTAHVPDGLPAHAVRVVGNPVRPGFAAAARDERWPEEAGVADGGGDPAEDSLRLLVFGGSQGATATSDLVPEALASLPAELRARIYVVQQCRPEDLERVERAYALAGIDAELAAFFDDMPARMAASDAVISRSGASSVAEILQLAKPSLLIPYPAAADDHQSANARALAEKGAAVVLPQSSLDARQLTGEIKGLFEDPGRLAAMAKAAAAMRRPDAAADLAEITLSALKDARA